MLKALFLSLFCAASLQGRVVEKILVLDVHSTINPSTLNYIESGLEQAQDVGADLVLIELGTPGGLLTTTKDILTVFGRSDVPFAVWVAPEGSSATSAGAILASGAHILVMSEGTNIGAATPITMSGDVENKDARNKAVNDLVALVQSLAEARKRNVEMFGEMIRSAASYKASEAKEKGLIDGIVNSRGEFIEFLRGRTIHLKGEDVPLDVAPSPEFVPFEMDGGQKLLNIFANPSLAYILFLIGAALIYLELQVAGGLIAGALGVLCIVLAGIGFQVLPLNFGGLGLIVLAFVLFVMEGFVTSYGLLSLAGAASLVFGSLFLYRTDDSYLSLSQSVIFSAVGAILVFLGLIVYVMVRERKNIGSVIFNRVVGKRAKIVSVLDETDGTSRYYQVKVGSEIWRAVSETDYRPGDFCTIKEKDQLTLKI